MIEVTDLRVCYKDVVAVDGVSLRVAEGETFAVIGPNGAGKTSMIECIEGLRKPESGVLRVNGVDPADRLALYRQIGVQLQESSFPDAVKVGELCRTFSAFYEKPADYRELLGRFGILDKEKAYYKKLSGGQKQKISVVLALIADPKIVFLDELTTGLDPKSRQEMWETVRGLRAEGRTIFMTTHFMEEAEALCDRVCLMVGGKIAAMGTVEQLVKEAKIDQKISFRTSGEAAEAIAGVAGIHGSAWKDGLLSLTGEGRNLLRDVVVRLAERDIDFTDLNYTKPGLEDVFFKLTGSELGVKS